WADAAARLEKILAHGGLDSSDRARAKWMLARCYRWTHRYDEAIALMEELRKDPSAGAFTDDLLATLATTYMKKNDYAKALAIRQGMMDRMPPGSRGAAQMAYKIAFLHMDEGKYAEAIPLWDRAASMRGAGREAFMARWYTGWCYYMQGDFASAVQAFDSLLKSGAKREGIDDRVQYWKARSLEHLKRAGEAKEIYRKIIQEHSGGYYAELSGRVLAGERRSTAEFSAVRDAWPEGGRSDPPGQEGGSGHIGRAAFFDRLGLHDEAAREVRAAAREGDGSAEEIMALAQRNFANDIAYSMAKTRYKNVLDDPPGRDGFARFVWEGAYPKAYAPAVERAAAQEGIDPRLAWSIMQNESAFRPAVVSPAGAVGLMQLMPTTAGKIAKERGGSGDPSKEDLARPAENISYGVAYMGKLARLFPGNSAAVAASYNAGEEAVARWLSNGSFTDIEQWIEEIPYDETNLYVKKVMTSYWKYQRLYGK
ncbi:MAG: transglycosylase SLT domain-containing protein, partial [bacterium]